MSTSLNTPKVFCIGFHKTGTTSLNDALTRLGYHVTGPNGVMDPDISDNVLDMCVELTKEYDAFIDNPWSVMFKEMDELYPDSKFILTIRPVDKWYMSICRHFQKTVTPMREFIYGVGCPVGNESIYKKRYLEHYDSVRKHFSGRNDDLLEFNLVGGDGWDKLCSFLGKEVINDAFPHRNKGNYEATL